MSDLNIAAIKTALPFVTDEDATILSTRGQLAQTADGKAILEEGSCRRRLIILLTGQARVVRNHLGSAVTVATISGPEPIGEVAYFDGLGASATVLADGPASTLQFEERHLSSLLYSVPGLAARLFQSLALVLARRLRTLTDSMPSFVAQDVPQVTKGDRSAYPASDADLPSAVVAAMEDFHRDMLKAQTGLKSRKSDLAAIDVLVALACDGVRELLARTAVNQPSTLEASGAYVFRETFPFMMSSALIERSYMKPRGYAGDFETIEIMYKGEPAGATPIGRMIDKWALSAGAAGAVRYRRTKIVNDVKALLARSSGAEPVAITSMAVGPGREIFDFFEALPFAPLRVVGIDIDDAALAFCADEARKRSLGHDKFRLVQDNLVKLSLGRGRVSIPKQHFIYSMGLIDYLDKEIVVRLISWAYDQLLPGGTLALGNFAAGSSNKAFMDYVMEWVLIHRTPDEMRDLFARSKFGKSDMRIEADPSGIQLFAYCSKS